MGTQKEMWKIRANNTIKREELLEENIEALYKVFMSICELVMKDQICNHKQDTLRLLKIIKKTMYSNIEDGTHFDYNHVIAVTNCYRVQQERYQSLQEYHDQIVAYRKVCEQLGIKVGASDNGSDNMLKRMKITNPTQQQREDAEKRLLRSIMPFFLY